MNSSRFSAFFRELGWTDTRLFLRKAVLSMPFAYFLWQKRLHEDGAVGFWLEALPAAFVLSWLVHFASSVAHSMTVDGNPRLRDDRSLFTFYVLAFVGALLTLAASGTSPGLSLGAD